jgi:hypothetical protein
MATSSNRPLSERVRELDKWFPPCGPCVICGKQTPVDPNIPATKLCLDCFRDRFEPCSRFTNSEHRGRR